MDIRLVPVWSKVKSSNLRPALVDRNALEPPAPLSHLRGAKDIETKAKFKAKIEAYNGSYTQWNREEQHKAQAGHDQ